MLQANCSGFLMTLVSKAFHRRMRRVVGGVAAIALMAHTAGAATTGNLETDPGFELNPLTTAGAVLNSPYPTGQWGAEASTITGTVGAVSPRTGSNMLSMTTDGGVATQTIQVVDVSAYATQINTGTATADYGAYYNVDSNVAAANAEALIEFWDSSHNYVGATNLGLTATIDNNPATWEAVGVSAVPIPVGTTYIVTQVAYQNASMLDSIGTDEPGYVDDASLTLTTVPEPASLGLCAVGMLGMLRIRRRK